MNGRLKAWLISAIEQGASSALSFVVMVLAARALNKESFGYVSTGWQIVVYGLTFTAGTIFSAMVLNLSGAGYRRLNLHARWVWNVKALLFILTMVLGFFAFILRGSPDFMPIILGGSAVAASRIAVEIDRRWRIVTGVPWKAALSSFVALCSVVFFLMAWRFFTEVDERTATGALLCCAIGFFLASNFGGLGLLFPPKSLPLPSKYSLSILRRYGRFFKWSIPTTLINLAGGLAAPFILVAATGPTSVAEFNAVRTIFGVLQVLIMGVVIHAAVRQKRAYIEGGMSGLWYETWPWMASSAGIGLIFLILMSVFGDAIISTVFGGHFTVDYLTIISFSVVYVLLGPSGLLGNAVEITGQLHWNLMASTAAAILTLALMYPVALHYGVGAGASVMVVTELAILCVRCWPLLLAARKI